MVLYFHCSALSKCNKFAENLDFAFSCCNFALVSLLKHAPFWRTNIPKIFRYHTEGTQNAFWSYSLTQKIYYHGKNYSHRHPQGCLKQIYISYGLALCEAHFTCEANLLFPKGGNLPPKYTTWTCFLIDLLKRLFTQNKTISLCALQKTFNNFAQ